MNPTLRLHRHLTGLIGCPTTPAPTAARACRVRAWADCGRVDTGPDGTDNRTGVSRHIVRARPRHQPPNRPPR